MKKQRKKELTVQYLLHRVSLCHVSIPDAFCDELGHFFRDVDVEFESLTTDDLKLKGMGTIIITTKRKKSKIKNLPFWQRRCCS
jgi:hypothetical protein